MPGCRRHWSSHPSSTLEPQQTARSRRYGGQYAQALSGPFMDPVDEHTSLKTNVVSGSPVVLGEALITSLTDGTNSDQTALATTPYNGNETVPYYTDVDGWAVSDTPAYQPAYPIQNTVPMTSTAIYPSYTHGDSSWTDTHPQTQDDSHSTYYTTASSPVVSYDNFYSQQPPSYRLDQSSLAVNQGTEQDGAHQTETPGVPDWRHENPDRQWSTQAENGSDLEPEGRSSPDEPSPQRDSGRRRGYRSAREPHDPNILFEYLTDEEAPFDGVVSRNSRDRRITRVLEDPRYHFQG